MPPKMAGCLVVDFRNGKFGKFNVNNSVVDKHIKLRKEKGILKRIGALHEDSEK